MQPRAMCRTSTSVRPSSKVGAMSTSANKRRRLLSVLCSSSSDEVMSQQGRRERGRVEDVENGSGKLLWRWCGGGSGHDGGV